MKIVNADPVKARRRCQRKGKRASSTESASLMHALAGKIPKRFLRRWHWPCENGVTVLRRLSTERMVIRKRMNLAEF